MAVGAVVAVGVGYGLSAAFGLNRAPKSNVRAQAQDRKQAIRSSVAPRQVVYGTARVSGPIVYASSTGSAKEQLHLVIPVACHRVAALRAIWINDQSVAVASLGPDNFIRTDAFSVPWPNATDPAAYDSPSGPRRGLVRVNFYTGSQTTADAALVAESTDGWSAAHVLRETAYAYLRLEYNRDIFANGPGAISLEVEGKSTILDPRTNSSGWTNNPALCILDYLSSADGLACSADEIDTASFIAAANVCDELVTIAANGTTQKRYTLDGAFYLDQKPIDIIDDMLTSCAGTLVYVAGKYRLYAGAYDAPTDTLTASDLAGPIELVTKPPRRELFNTVRGTFIHPGRNWQASEFPAYSEAALIAADGETITTDIEWPFTTDEIRAQQLAKLMLRRSREALTVRVLVKYAGLRYCVWQTLNVTLADFGWTNKPFRIVAWTFDADSGVINLTLREESANSYSWQFGDASPLALAPDTDLVDPLTIPAPTNVTVTASTTLQPDGSVAPALLVAWTSAAFAFLSAHEVQWRVNGAADWNSGEVPVGTDRFFIAPVIAGTIYQVRVRGVTGIARGAWSSIVSGTASGDATTPNAPTGLAATGITRGISLTWTLPAAPDLAAVEVWENTSSSTAGRYFVGETRATGFVRTGLAPSTTRHFWVRSRDLSGNLSAFSGSVSATTAFIVAADIQDGILNTAKFAAGITPVEIVSSLPSTGNFEGRMVFLTTDDKLYRWTGSAWTAAVPAVDITGQLTDAQLAAINAAKLTGQITTTQISDSAISTPKLQAASVLAANIAAGAVVAEKIAGSAITAEKIAAGAVEASKIAANAITSDKIAANAITAGKIAAAAISSNQIAAGEVRAANLAANAVVAGKIAAGAIDGIEITGSVIRTNATTTRVQLDTTGNKLTVLRSGNEVVKIAAPQENTYGIMTVFPGSDAFGIASVGTGAQIVGLVSSGATGPAAVSGLSYVTGGSRIGVRGTTSLGVGVQGEAGQPVAEGTQGVGVLGRGVVGVVGRGRIDNALPGVRSDRGSDGAAGLGTMQAAAYNNFTGAHLDAIAKTEAVEPGDILIPAGIVARVSVLDALINVARSTGANQPAAGVFVSRMPLAASPLLIETDAETGQTHIKAEYADLADTHDLAHHAALGEGCMNVCGEGGDIQPGDLIVTSSIAGKGMRKSNNTMDSTVVSKAREAMTFAGATDVKLVAVAFLCG